MIGGVKTQPAPHQYLEKGPHGDKAQPPYLDQQGKSGEAGPFRQAGAPLVTLGATARVLRYAG